MIKVFPPPNFQALPHYRITARFPHQANFSDFHNPVSVSTLSYIPQSFALTVILTLTLTLIHSALPYPLSSITVASFVLDDSTSCLTNNESLRILCPYLTSLPCHIIPTCRSRLTLLHPVFNLSRHIHHCSASLTSLPSLLLFLPYYSSLPSTSEQSLLSLSNTYPSKSCIAII